MEGKLRQVGTQINYKSMAVAKGDVLKTRALPLAEARFLKIRGSKLGVKFYQLSIKNEVNMERHLGIDSGGFSEPSWSHLGSKNPFKK